MKTCENCGKAFDALEAQCPICGGELHEADNTDEIIAVMLLIGML